MVLANNCVAADPRIVHQGFQTILLDDAFPGSVSQKDKLMEQLLFDTTFRFGQINTCSIATADTTEDGYSSTDEEGQGWVYRDQIPAINTAGSSIASSVRWMSEHVCM